MITVTDMIRLGTDKLLELFGLDNKQELACLMVDNNIHTLEELAEEVNLMAILCMRCGSEYVRIEDNLCPDCQNELFYSE